MAGNPRDVLRVRGLRELQQACLASDRGTRREVRKALRQVGDIVRSEGARLFHPIDAKTAAGFRVYVRQRGVAVEQSLRKTTGEHPEFGALQMTKALLPARSESKLETERLFELALDEVERIFYSEGV